MPVSPREHADELKAHAKEDGKLGGGMGQDDQFHGYHGDAQQVNDLLHPYQSQHPSPADIRCHL